MRFIRNNRGLLRIAGGALFAIGLIAWGTRFAGDGEWNFLAALFFPESITTAELKQHYADQRLKILIVPGHDNENWGTEFRNIREADLTLKTAEQLQRFLNQNPAFQVFVTRDQRGYAPLFENYFSTQSDAINKFKTAKLQMMRQATQLGYEERTEVFHNVAPSDTVFKLYGINKWANDQDIDVVVH